MVPFFFSFFQGKTRHATVPQPGGPEFTAGSFQKKPFQQIRQATLHEPNTALNQQIFYSTSLPPVFIGSSVNVIWVFTILMHTCNSLLLEIQSIVRFHPCFFFCFTLVCAYSCCLISTCVWLMILFSLCVCVYSLRQLQIHIFLFFCVMFFFSFPQQSLKEGTAVQQDHIGWLLVWCLH